MSAAGTWAVTAWRGACAKAGDRDGLILGLGRAGPGTVSRIIAGWPALALLIAVKLLSGILGHRTASSPTGDQNASDLSPRACVPIPSRPRPQTAAVPPRSSAAHGTKPAASTEARTLPGLAIAGLLPAARAARDELHSDGRRLTRDALASRLRENGHPAGNSRLTPLLRALRSETTTPPPACTGKAA